MTRREIEVTDINEIEGMLSRAKFLHLGLVDRGRPYIVPMNYGYEMNEGRLTLYLHSGMKGHKMDLIINNPDCRIVRLWAEGELKLLRDMKPEKEQ